MSRNLCFYSSSLIDTVSPAFPQQKSIIFLDMPYKNGARWYLLILQSLKLGGLGVLSSTLTGGAV